MSCVEYDDVDQGLDVAKVEKELKEARQLKAARDKILAAGRRRGTKRRHVVVSFTLDELAEAVGVSKRTLQWWRKTRRVDLSDRAAVVTLLRYGGERLVCESPILTGEDATRLWESLSTVATPEEVERRRTISRERLSGIGSDARPDRRRCGT